MLVDFMRGRISILIALILVTGCFFSIQNGSFGVQASAKRENGDFGNFAFNFYSADSTREIMESVDSRFHGNDIKRSVEKYNRLTSQFSGRSIRGSFCLNFQNKSPETTEIEKELYAITRGYPIEEMVPHIARYDRRTAALIIGIAKKESDWGKRSPSKNGKICYNYWGYKGAGSRGRVMNYGCFSSPREAVEIVGGRIKELVGENLNTPSKMIVWKCGNSCRGHNPAGVRKWISDVDIYFNKIVLCST